MFNRWAIQVTMRNGIRFVSIGTGMTEHISEAHLYTTYALAVKKAGYYINNCRWYKDVKILKFNVSLEPADG